MQNELLIFIIGIIIIIPVICLYYKESKESKESFEKTFTQINSKSPCLTKKDYYTPTKKCVYHERYTFSPYYMNDIIYRNNNCYTNEYWDCIVKNNGSSDVINPNDIPKELLDQCKERSNQSCNFPAIITTSRTEPYIQEFNYD